MTKQKEARELAEKHWKYTEKIILHQLELAHYLYVEAMIHGIKHGEDNQLQGRREGYEFWNKH